MINATKMCRMGADNRPSALVLEDPLLVGISEISFFMPPLCSPPILCSFELLLYSFNLSTCRRTPLAWAEPAKSRPKEYSHMGMGHVRASGPPTSDSVSSIFVSSPKNSRSVTTFKTRY